MAKEASRFLSISSLVTAGAAGLAVYWRTRSAWGAAVASAVYPFFAGFARRVWQELQPKWASITADWIDRRVRYLISGYTRLYRQHLIYKHRTFDVKGFSTQGPYALELEAVFVDLSVDPTSAGAISQDPISRTSYALRRSIFDWLSTDSKKDPKHLAIIGAPGSGKTTLLKHLALLLSAKQAPFSLLPFLLWVRDSAAAIAEKRDLTLVQVIEASLADLKPPTGWVGQALKSGKCIIMFDGLDEVANIELRLTVVKWIEHQAEIFGNNRFLVSSRPNGYRNNPISDFTVLRVLPFDGEQVKRFVHNWYLANELMAHQRDDPGVRMEASRMSSDLLLRIRRSPTLQELAANPLLITLIATVHRYRSELPGRRVELYREICEVFLGKRQQARGIELDLTPAQKICVLRVLAYRMMQDKKRELHIREASDAIASILPSVDPSADCAAFLRMVEDSSGLLLQREADHYGFAHLTFQEYLASVHIKEEGEGPDLVSRISDPWWNETIRLFAAQADASAIVEACLRLDHPDMEQYILAVDCADESLQLRTDLRYRLMRLTDVAAEDPDPDRSSFAAEVVLAHRFKTMAQVEEDVYIDRRLITNAEYQIFVSDCRAQGKYTQPDHWNDLRFSSGTALLPVTGLRSADAKAFCVWLSHRTVGAWHFRLPTETEARSWEGIRESGRDLCFWQSSPLGETTLSDQERHRWRLCQSPTSARGQFLSKQLESDSRLLAHGDGSGPRLVRAHLRVLLSNACEMVAGASWQHPVLSGHRASMPLVDDYDLAEALHPDLDRAANLDRSRLPGRPLDLSLSAKRADGRCQALEVDFAQFPLFARESGFKPVVNSFWRLLLAYCAIEEEAEGKIPVQGALWVVRTSSGSFGKDVSERVRLSA